MCYPACDDYYTCQKGPKVWLMHLFDGGRPFYGVERVLLSDMSDHFARTRGLGCLAKVRRV